MRQVQDGVVSRGQTEDVESSLAHLTPSWHWIRYGRYLFTAPEEQHWEIGRGCNVLRGELGMLAEETEIASYER